MSSVKTTYGPKFRDLWFESDSFNNGPVWPVTKQLKGMLEDIVGCDLKSYGSNRKGELPFYRIFSCVSHKDCPFKVKAIRISGCEGKAGAQLHMSLTQHSNEDAPLRSSKYLKLPHNLDRHIEDLVGNNKPLRAYSQIKAEKPQQLRKVALSIQARNPLPVALETFPDMDALSLRDAVSQGREIATGPDGFQMFVKTVKNKRRASCAKNRRPTVSFDQLLSEVSNCGFVSADASLIRALGDSLRSMPLELLHLAASFGDDDPLYNLGSIQIAPSRPGEKPQAMVALSSRLALTNIFTAFSPSSPFLGGPRQSLNALVSPSVSADGHFKSIRGCGAFFDLSILHYTSKPNSSAAPDSFGWSTAPALVGLGLSESKACMSFLFQQLRTILQIFFGEESYTPPSTLVCDASPGIVASSLTVWGGMTWVARCLFHASEDLARVSMGSKALKERFLAHARHVLQFLSECAGEASFRCYTQLALAEIETLFGKDASKTLETSWLTNTASFGYLYHPSPAEILAGKRYLGAAPTTNNCEESGFSVMRCHYLNMTRLPGLVGKDGAVTRLRDYLRAIGDCAPGARITASSSGYMRMESADMSRKASERLTAHASNLDGLLREVDITEQGDRVFCVASSRKVSPMTELEASGRAQFEKESTFSGSALAFEEGILKIHLVVARLSSDGTPPLLLCSCRGFASSMLCHHVLLVRHSLGLTRLPGRVVIPSLAVGRPRKTARVTALRRHPTDTAADQALSTAGESTAGVVLDSAYGALALEGASGSVITFPREPGNSLSPIPETREPVETDMLIQGHSLSPIPETREPVETDMLIQGHSLSPIPETREPVETDMLLQGHSLPPIPKTGEPVETDMLIQGHSMSSTSGSKLADSSLVFTACSSLPGNSASLETPNRRSKRIRKRPEWWSRDNIYAC